MGGEHRTCATVGAHAGSAELIRPPKTRGVFRMASILERHEPPNVVLATPPEQGAIDRSALRPWITGLSLLISALALVAAATGVLTASGAQHTTFVSLRHEIISIQGGGLYAYDSVSAAAQAIGQDYVTLLVCVPRRAPLEASPVRRVVVFRLHLSAHGIRRRIQPALPGVCDPLLSQYLRLPPVAACDRRGAACQVHSHPISRGAPSPGW